MAKKIEIISKKLKTLDKSKHLLSYINKKVYSKSGEVVGNIYDVLLDKGRFSGFLVGGKRKMFIGKEFIESESAKALVLNMDPVFNMIGKLVYDGAGKKIGNVSGVNRKSNANVYSEIMVKTSLVKRSTPVSREDVGIAKKSIILKKAHGI